MNVSELILRGPVIHTKELRNDRQQITGHSVQLMTRGPRGFSVLNVKLPEDAKPEDYKEGTNVELAVGYSVFEGNVYFRATRNLKSATPAERPAPAPVKPA